MYSYQKGFILVTTLWVLAILTIAASFFALWTQRTVAVVQSMQDDVQGEIDMYNTQSHIIYLLTTQRFTIAGLTLSAETKAASKKIPTTLEELTDDEKTLDEIMDEFIEMQKRLKAQQQKSAPMMEESRSVLPEGGEIALDDRPYVGFGKAYFALQDIGGLFNLGFASEFTFKRFLGLLGVEAELQAPLYAKFQDYIDLDDLHRLNGAEASHYEERLMPPPPNRFLITPMESYLVFDWANQTKLWQNNQLEQLTQVVSSIQPNFNTAPSIVLQAAYNLNATAAERIIKIRQSIPFYTLHAVTQIAGMSPQVDFFETNFFPTPALRLTLWYEGAQRMRQIYVRATHQFYGLKPWQLGSSIALKLLPYYTETRPNHAQTTLFNTTLPTKTQ